MLLPVFLPWLLLCFYNLRGLDKSGNDCQPEGLVGPEIRGFVVKSEHLMLWFCGQVCWGPNWGAVMPTCLEWWQRNSRRRKIIYLLWGFFSGQQVKTPLRSRVMMGDGRHCVQFWIVTGAAAAAIWKQRFPLCRRWGARVGIEAPETSCSVSILNPLAWEWRRREEEPVQLELPFELVFHFPDQCFSHALKFKTNWKYFRTVSIHSLICLIAVWQYEISSECIPFSKIIITIATHTTSET